MFELRLLFPKKLSKRGHLRLGLFLYICLLLLGPEAYSVYNVSVDVMSTVLSLYATIFFIAFLRSRKPADQHILNRLMLMNFYLKLLYYPLYYMGLYIGFQGHSMDKTTKFWLLKLGSYSSGRIWIIMMVAMYTLVSASRALYFISPAKMQSLNTKFCLRVSKFLMLLLFVVEVVLSQVVFSPANCDVNENGHELHTFDSYQFIFDPTNVSNQTREYYQTPDYSQIEDCDQNLDCDQFLINDEANQTLVNNSVLDLDQTFQRFKELFPNETFESNQTLIKETNILPKVCTLFPTLRILLVLIVVLETTRLSVAIARLLKRQKKRRVTQKNLVTPHSNAQSGPLVLTTPAIESSTSREHELSVLSLETAIAPIHHQLFTSSPSASKVPLKNSTFTEGNPDELLSSSSGPSPTHSLMASPISGPALASAPLHPFAPELTATGELQMSEVITPSVSVSIPPLVAPETLTSTGRLKERLNIPSRDEYEVKETFREVKKITLLLIQRVYSLVIIFVVLYLISFLLPNKFYFMRQTRLQAIISKLDIFFVPVFWILIDKDVLRYTEKKTTNIYRILKMKFNE